MVCGAVCSPQKSMGKIGVSPAHKIGLLRFGGLKLLYLNTDWSMCMVSDLGYKKKSVCCFCGLCLCRYHPSDLDNNPRCDLAISLFSKVSNYFPKKGPQHCWLVHTFLFYTPSNQTSMTRRERIHPTNMFQQVQRILRGGWVFTHQNKPVTY